MQVGCGCSREAGGWTWVRTLGEETGWDKFSRQGRHSSETRGNSANNSGPGGAQADAAGALFADLGTTSDKSDLVPCPPEIGKSLEGSWDCRREDANSGAGRRAWAASVRVIGGLLLWCHKGLWQDLGRYTHFTDTETKSQGGAMKGLRGRVGASSQSLDLGPCSFQGSTNN